MSECFGANFYICKIYEGKTVWGEPPPPFLSLPPPPSLILNRVNKKFESFKNICNNTSFWFTTLRFSETSASSCTSESSNIQPDDYSVIHQVTKILTTIIKTTCVSIARTKTLFLKKYTTSARKAQSWMFLYIYFIFILLRQKLYNCNRNYPIYTVHIV